MRAASFAGRREGGKKRKRGPTTRTNLMNLLILLYQLLVARVRLDIDKLGES